MLIKKVLPSLFFFLCLYINVHAQDDEFCTAINAIVRDAPDKFRNIRGNVTDANANATIWACGIKVPGTISSRFVASLGLFYEGAVFQSKNKNELKAVYDQYKEQLSTCLIPQGYQLSLSPNFSAGLEGYKKLVFIREPKEVKKPGDIPPHITMEALYSKEIGLYTVVIYIFEH